MSETGAAENQKPTAEPGEGRFLIQKIYIKDISYEAPHTPETFRVEWRPNIDVQLNSDAKGIAENLYEVVLRITVTAKVGENTAFLVEVHQAGIFGVAGFPPDNLKAILGSYCPNVLFPYAREAISDFVSRGGFPQLLLAPVNFDALYLKHLQEGQQKHPQQTTDPMH
jgi:preprotein translocase subunit SecB